MSTKITKATLPRLTCPPGRAEMFFWDADLPGFGLRASAGGKRSWVAQYRAAGRTRRLSLGDAAVVPVDKARDAARAALAGAALGHDPASQKQAARRALRLADLIEDYLRHQIKHLKPRSLIEISRHLRKHASPLHHETAAGVTRGDVVRVLDRIASESGPVAANRVRATLSGMWTWALRAGRLDGENPVARTPKQGVEAPRSRVLTDDELAAIWLATHGGTDHDRIVRLLMLTGARREEVAAMAWAEIVGNVWTLPAARSKNHRPHEVPLCPLALVQLPVRIAGKELLFGKRRAEGPERVETGFSGWSRCKDRLDGRMRDALHKAFVEVHGREPGEKEAVLAPWTLHDLRRTMATRMADLGVQPHVIEALLNHISGHKAGVAGIYNRSAYTAEKRAALLLWEAHVRRLVGLEEEAASVVRLRA